MLPNINQKNQGFNVQLPNITGSQQGMAQAQSAISGQAGKRPIERMAPDNGQHGGAPRYMTPQSGANNKAVQRRSNPYSGSEPTTNPYPNPRERQDVMKGTPQQNLPPAQPQPWQPSPWQPGPSQPPSGGQLPPMMPAPTAPYQEPPTRRTAPPDLGGYYGPIGNPTYGGPSSGGGGFTNPFGNIPLPGAGTIGGALGGAFGGLPGMFAGRAAGNWLGNQFGSEQAGPSPFMPEWLGGSAQNPNYNQQEQYNVTAPGNLRNVGPDGQPATGMGTYRGGAGFVRGNLDPSQFIPNEGPVSRAAQESLLDQRMQNVQR